MSINPASDIVLDVARAAAPSQSSAAAERLWRLGSMAPAAGDFAGMMAPTATPDGELRGQIAMLSDKPARTALAPSNERTSAYKGVEELVLQRLVEAMLPKEDSGVFGSGAAGDVWRSMLAEQLAKQIGKTVDLGLGKGPASTAVAMRDDGHAIAPVGPSAQQRS